MFNPKKSRYRQDNGKYCIDLQLTSPNQLFDERDPAPFRYRDLDEDAADYIYGSFVEIPEDAPAKIVLTFPAVIESQVYESVIRDAIRSFFEYEDEKARRGMNAIFKQNRYALSVGIFLLSTCMALTRAMANYTPSGFFWSALKEGLTIMSWVAMFRPLDIFIYEWWPVLRKRRYYQRLQKIEIQFQFAATSP